MKQIEKNELIEGRIYSSKLSWHDSTELFIWKCDKNGKLFYSYRLLSKDKVSGTFGVNSRHGWDNIFEATPEEKHWLETCIKADKFISYEEAMKTFIPEYVEILDNGCAINNNVIIGKIYKTYRNFSHIYDICILLDNKYRIGFYGDQLKKYLKPSTKEAYDAQFVVKEPKVVLEEPKDKVLLSSSEQYLNAPFNIIKVECSEGGVYKIGDKITVFDKYSPNKGKMFTIQRFRWSNDKSKICAVTEQHAPNGIGLDKIELYVEPKVKFVLPEKWCIKSGENLVLDYCNKNGVSSYSKSELQANYAHFPSHDDCTTCSFIFKDYTEITFEQFKKYVLKDE